MYKHKGGAECNVLNSSTFLQKQLFLHCNLKEFYQKNKGFMKHAKKNAEVVTFISLVVNLFVVIVIN